MEFEIKKISKYKWLGNLSNESISLHIDLGKKVHSVYYDGILKPKDFKNELRKRKIKHLNELER